MIKKITKGLLFSQVILALIYLQNCGPGNLAALGGELLQVKTTADEDTQGFSSKKTCEFVGVDGIRNMITTQLGIERGDVPILDNNGNIKNDGVICGGECYYLEQYADQLGQADIGNDVKEDLACSPTKFKPLLEIFLNGCYLGLQNTAVQQNLFPNGVSDYDAIYLTFIGRLPTSSEESILDDLVASLDSADKQMAGVCSAVASSLESVTNM